MRNQIITKHLKLPFQFNEERLVNELELLLSSEWIPHFNKDGFSGDWNSIALYALDGNQNNIFAHNDGESVIKETPILQPCEYLKKVISTFQCPLLSVRLLKLSPGGYIKPHRDYKLGYEDNCFRVHIPITTNPNVSFILDEQPIVMNPGECWYTNVNFIHSVSNGGVSDRVHLVIDGQRNEWSDELFFSLVPKENLLAEPKQSYDSGTIKKMIVELEKIQSSGAKQLIDDLKNQLSQL